MGPIPTNRFIGENQKLILDYVGKHIIRSDDQIIAYVRERYQCKRKDVIYSIKALARRRKLIVFHNDYGTQYVLGDK